MTRVRLHRNLTLAVAEGPVRRAVDRVTDAAVRAVREHAPDAKTWVSTQQIRPEHVEASGQIIPGNLPFRIPRPIGAGWDLAAEPRDPGLPAHQRVNCRCQSVPAPGAIANAVTRTPVQIGRARVHATVIVTFPRVAESEFAPDGGWLAAAARSVAART
ncbi:hypothetical protein ACFWYW_46425 [Nonomuraea sp. NPDC059023]|uniref:hypothetical protein n=1 Tax=unclassified Nonomuraea TaxID=2593643 RepID=UPI0036B54182